MLCRKEQWGQSVCQVWSVLLTQTRLESREHAALGDTCCNTLTQQLAHGTEDTHRLHKRVSGSSVEGPLLAGTGVTPVLWMATARLGAPRFRLVDAT